MGKTANFFKVAAQNNHTQHVSPRSTNAMRSNHDVTLSVAASSSVLAIDRGEQEYPQRASRFVDYMVAAARRLEEHLSLTTPSFSLVPFV